MQTLDLESPELHLLSALMHSPRDVFAAVEQGLEDAHFSPPAAAIFRALKLAASNGGDTSAAGVWVHVEAGANLTPLDLARVEGLQPTSAHRTKLVQAVVDADRSRRLVAELSTALETAKDAKGQPYAEVWDRIAPYVEAAQGLAVSRRRRSISDYAAAVVEAATKPDTAARLRMGWPRWDADATPLRAGEMVTLAARPGLGKTALALQLAVRTAEREGTAVFFSLEMAGEELVERIAKHRGGFYATRDEETFLREVRRVGDLRRLVVYDNGDRHTMASIEARCRLHAAAPDGLALVVIDYLQLIEPTDRRVNREQQVAEISRRCKQLAGIVRCPVLVLAQLNRDIEKESRKPRLSDLRESGAIEQDSDRVLFLWQDPALALPGQAESSAIEVLLIQRKCRGGPPDVGVRLMFNRPCFTFAPVASEPAPQTDRPF